MTKRVLIAEDEESIVASLEFLMQRAGYETCVARDGPSALARIADFEPDLVLLDIMLPGRSGFDVCTRIRQSPALAATRVVMLTMRASEREVLATLEIGATDHIAKPFSVAVLMQRVRRLLAR